MKLSHSVGSVFLERSYIKLWCAETGLIWDYDEILDKSDYIHIHDALTSAGGVLAVHDGSFTEPMIGEEEKNQDGMMLVKM